MNKQRRIKYYGTNTCVVDHVWDQCRGKKGFKTYTYEKLKDEIMSFSDEEEGVCTDELKDWAKNCHTNVSIHAYDARYKTFMTFTNKNTQTDVCLVYIVKDGHCHPITDERLKLVALKTNQGGCDNLLKYMTELKWTRRHENVFKINSLDEIENNNKKNSIIILPEDAHMNDAIQTYSLTSNYYVEFLHWDGKGVLDGFIDHNKNVFLLNNEYDTRKRIRSRLYSRFKTHDFQWSNQSCTSLASALFKQMCGFFPESEYNVHTRQMLDDF